MTDAIAHVADRSAQPALGTAVASIMVYVDFDPGCDDRIKIAVDWAARLAQLLSALQAGCLGAKLGAGSLLNWNGPKIGATEY